MQSIEKRAIELGKALTAREWKVVTVESCTAGGVAYIITAVPGSSAWFERGFVTYSNLAKEELVGVKDGTLLEHGAVSAATAREMAEGGLENSQSQVCIAITGIAGPGGGTAAKPVGTVWFAVAGISRATEVKQMIFPGDREAVRKQAIEFALEMLIDFVG